MIIRKLAITLILCLTLISALASPAACRAKKKKAAPAPATVVPQIVSAPIIINGRVTKISGIVAGDRTVVPVRDLFEMIGAHVIYFEDRKEIRIEIGWTVFIIKLGDMIVNEFYKGHYCDTFELDPPPMELEGKIYVPLRFFCEELKIDLGWDEKNRTVTLTSRSLKMK